MEHVLLKVAAKACVYYYMCCVGVFPCCLRHTSLDDAALTSELSLFQKANATVIPSLKAGATATDTRPIPNDDGILWWIAVICLFASFALFALLALFFVLFVCLFVFV